MRISSKSILSPGRAGFRDPPNSLSTSLSRRLRNSGSIKGGASPAMFPTTAKKRGSFENPEPSSPKVTCIGQVRVKSKKKQAKKLRSLSRRHSAGDVSFRKLEHPLNGFPSKTQYHDESLDLGSKGTQNDHHIQNQNPNQECSPAQRSWVHFPVTICDALRAFGSEFSCLFPCRTERGKEEKMVAAEGDHRQGSCGAVFARWLVAVQDGDGGGERDIELVVGDDDEEEESVVRKRRHVFEDLEIINDRIEGFHKDEARVSICVPPKNALLLMRSRSDPVKIEALTNRSWEPTIFKYEEEEEFVDHEYQIEEDLKKPQENLEAEQKQDMVLDQHHEHVQQDEADQEQENIQQDEAIQDEEHNNVQQDEANQDEEHDIVQNLDSVQDQEHDNVQKLDLGQDHDQEYIEDEEGSLYLVSLFEEIVNQDHEIQEQDVVDSDMEEAHEEDDVPEIGAEESAMVTESANISEIHEEEMVNEVEERNNGVVESEKVLPECLLMMMYEPKLSMEVSKETWVCSKDFIRRHPSRRKPPPPVKPNGGDKSSDSATDSISDVMRVANGGLPPVLLQPARSSCSLPVAPSMATLLEQKLENAVGYEPFVLTRCKSEPMKTAAAKLLPESCVWENRKLERLSRVAFGVGAAGLGF